MLPETDTSNSYVNSLNGFLPICFAREVALGAVRYLKAKMIYILRDRATNKAKFVRGRLYGCVSAETVMLEKNNKNRRAGA